jgi:hypothetical protein
MNFFLCRPKRITIVAPQDVPKPVEEDVDEEAAQQGPPKKVVASDVNVIEARASERVGPVDLE